jgi:hypothetical protein
MKNSVDFTELCSGICLTCKHKGYKSDGNFQKTGCCLKKFWADRPNRLTKNKPVLKCSLFEPESL